MLGALTLTLRVFYRVKRYIHRANAALARERGDVVQAVLEDSRACLCTCRLVTLDVRRNP
jgi:hypothetical protein